MKKILRKIVDSTLVASNTLFNKISQPTIVLMYHRINDENIDKSVYTVSCERFREQIRYLKEAFTIVRFEDDWDKFDKPNIVITFDDGYYDNYDKALKILKEEDVPATFFITTGNLDTKKLFWWDELAQNIDVIKEHSSLSDAELHVLFKNKKLDEQEKFFEKYRPFYKTVDEGITQYYRFLNSKELYDFSQNELVTIGAHTVTHPKLSILSKDEILRELQESKESLEKLIKKDVTVAAYPFGGYMDYNSDVIEVCKELGFKKATTTVECNNYPWTHQMKIPRYQVEDDSIDVFKAKIEKMVH
jgi:peptidoglycan/xylan/chitin deacetylase (PgdA/CDA1 family)